MAESKDEIAVYLTAIFKKDNTVTPLSFIWTDGEKYIIDKVIDVQKGSTLKKRGGGIRYKIRIQSKAIEKVSYLFRFGDTWYLSSESGNDLPSLQTRHSDMVSDPVLDSRYDNPYKASVDVKAVFSPDGFVKPLSFVWEDGTEYEIDKILVVEKAVSLKAGITGLRYDIKVMGKQTALFRDGDLWFMERNIKGAVFDIHGNRVK